VPGRRSLRLAIPLATAALLALAACQPTKPPPPPPPGAPTLDVQTNFVTGLDKPWDIGFVPGDVNTFFFTENDDGTINVSRNGTVTNLPLIDTPISVSTGEGGMMGLAVDPNFATNRFIYTCFSTGTDNRVVRWTVNAAFNGFDARNDIVTGLPYNSGTFPGRHSGCRPRFRPGTSELLIGTGDSATGIVAINIDSLGGKVLRVDTNGTAVAGNPFIGGAGDDRIYTFGHRNVQGLAFRPGTSEIYSIEHGPGTDDEVNRLVAGGHYGWDGDNDSQPDYEENVPMTDVGQFPSAIQAAWSSGSPTVAPSGGTFLSGPQWEAWDGRLAVAMLVSTRLRVFGVDGSGAVTGFTDVLQNGVRLRSTVQGPDGNLYITTDVGGTGGAIWKVTPS
jgi:glucose/arabinose dehydrogenase